MSHQAPTLRHLARGAIAALTVMAAPIAVLPSVASASAATKCHVTAKDVDGDCVPNTRDRDIDGDGIPNYKDADMDGDHHRNKSDADVDGDGAPNTKDKMPYGVIVKGTRYGSYATGRLPISTTAKSALAQVPKGLNLPRSFFGLVSEDALAQTSAAGAPAMRQVAASGAGLLRQTFSWANIELSPGAFDFSAYDNFVADAARNNIDLLPVLFDPPAFRKSPGAAGTRAASPPASNTEFARFAGLLVARYGPGGTFWAAHPSLPAHPIRSWQVWNEPNLPVYWGGAPDAQAYTAMLRTVHTAIRTQDPTATVVTAGLPDSRLGVSPDKYLSAMYAAGARGTFEALGVNPYATTADGVLQIVATMRSLMNAKGDSGSAIWATEIGWATSGTTAPFDLTPKAQAVLLTQTLGVLAANAQRLNLRGVVYYAWRDLPVYAGGKDFWGLHTGLLSASGAPKPALGALVSTVGKLVR